MAKIEENLWTYEHAFAKIEEVSGKKSDIELEAIAKDILGNHSISDLLIDKLITLIVNKFGFTRTALKKFLRAEVKKQTEGDDEEATHAEIAEDFIAEKLPNETIGTENDLWTFSDDEGIYEKRDMVKVEVQIGNEYSASNCKTGGQYQAITRQVYIRKLKEGFFDDSPVGVAAKSTFHRICKINKQIYEEEYTPDHRVRWKLPFDPAPAGTPAPLFRKYLDDAFAGQLEQQLLLQEVSGGIVTGILPELQKAVLLKGEGENGKSVFLDMLAAFFDQKVRTSIPPERFNDDKMSFELAGKIVNIVGELEKDVPLTSQFKLIVGADTPIVARPVFKNPFLFTPKCSHIYASNFFPLTRDFSKAFFRRWVIITFINPVPKDKIRRLGERIVKEEGPQVLRWMLEGAYYLINNKDRDLSFTNAHHDAINNWKSSKDSVFAFFNDEEEIKLTDSDHDRVPHKECYKKYIAWCSGEGKKGVGYNSFMERAKILVQADFRTPTDRRRSFRGISFLSAKNSTSKWI